MFSDPKHRMQLRGQLRMIGKLALALAGLGLQGCAFYAGDYRFGIGENIQATLYVADPDPPLYEPYDFYVPDVVIVENGIRHDHYYYQHHPEHYHRDRLRYPERFNPPPPPSVHRHEREEYPRRDNHQGERHFSPPPREGSKYHHQSTPSNRKKPHEESKEKDKHRTGGRDH